MEPIPPYYGDIVRKLFIICGLVILITLPFLKTNTSSPIFYSLLIVIVLAFFAGMTNPKHKNIILSDVFISMLGFGIFAYQAIVRFNGFLTLFFFTNLTLSILFLFAFYWSVKTARDLKFQVKTKTRGMTDRDTDRSVLPLNASENTPAAPPKELTAEERRIKRFLNTEE